MMLRNSVREFVRKEVPEDYVRHCDQNKIAPLDTYDKMAELGWLGVAIPEEYGGSGLGLSSLGLFRKSCPTVFWNWRCCFIAPRFTAPIRC